MLTIGRVHTFHRSKVEPLIGSGQHEGHQVVTFRTFFKPLIHEPCHPLDHEWLKLADSLHTEGFYKRESSLMQQLADKGGKPKNTYPAVEQQCGIS